MRLATLALYSTMTLRLSTPSSTLDPAWMCTEEVGLVSAEGSRTPARVWGRWTVASGDLPSACGSGFDFAVCACSRCIFAGLTRGCDCGLRSASLCFDRWCLRRMVHVPYAYEKCSYLRTYLHTYDFLENHVPVADRISWS